ncbi:MAG: MBL fold metallo-hydrolase [Anaerolineae bacterium]|nr:MBL fold metallo-hydrolase [Thermoflexales bacterium]MDW8394999.1 MBL fold metallo-hydrolase [Anaerolineae bacterium]
MEITWYGHCCVRMTERATIAIVTDPYTPANGSDLPKLRADVVTISRDDPLHNNINAVAGAQRGDVRRITGPGEYEIGGVFIIGVAMRPEKKGAAASRSTVYAFNFDGLTIAHLGGLSFVPTQAQIDALETVDVLLVPIGGEPELSPLQAAEVISMIEPSIVVPIGYGAQAKGKEALSRFLKEMGASSLKPLESLKVTKSQLPEETQVVLLEARA